MTKKRSKTIKLYWWSQCFWSAIFCTPKLHLGVTAISTSTSAVVFLLVGYCWMIQLEHQHFGSVSFDIDHLGPFAKWTVGTDPHTKTRSFNSLLLDYLESEPLSSLLSTGIYVLLITSVDSKQALRSTDSCTRWAENPVSESAQISLIEFFRFIYMHRNLRWI